jgi:hypothetical protein
MNRYPLGSLKNPIPYEVWSEEERKQYNRHVRQYYWFLSVAQEEDIDADLGIPVPPSEIIKQ